MNYVEHHIGDFLKKTIHQTALEDGIYRRLLDCYYITEAPLPADFRECCRRARAVTKVERNAVTTVLREFFTLESDGHHQKRADEEIARFKDKQAKAKRSANARWDAQRNQSSGNADAGANAMRTHSDGNANGMHRAPVPSHQSPVTSLEIQDPPRDAGPPQAEARAKTLRAKDLEADGVDAKVAADWLTIRRAKKAPLTSTAWDCIKREAFKAGISPSDAVRAATENGWQGFKADWLARVGQDNRGAGSGQKLLDDPFARAI